MAASERDKTEDWVLAPEARPATWAEMEGRIDYALAVAQASERAAVEIGAAAIDAAEQARRAAELAVAASAGDPGSAHEAGGTVMTRAGDEPVVRGGDEGVASGDDVEPQLRPEPPGATTAVKGPPAADHDLLLAQFMAQADRVSARLLALDRAAGASL